jgi:hypothetical protein
LLLCNGWCPCSGLRSRYCSSSFRSSSHSSN